MQENITKFENWFFIRKSTFKNDKSRPIYQLDENIVASGLVINVRDTIVFLKPFNSQDFKILMHEKKKRITNIFLIILKLRTFNQ